MKVFHFFRLSCLRLFLTGVQTVVPVWHYSHCQNQDSHCGISPLVEAPFDPCVFQLCAGYSWKRRTLQCLLPCKCNCSLFMVQDKT